MDLILPEELLEHVQPQIENASRSLQYYRVILPLLALVEGELFNVDIKTRKSQYHESLATPADKWR